MHSKPAFPDLFRTLVNMCCTLKLSVLLHVDICTLWTVTLTNWCRTHIDWSSELCLAKLVLKGSVLIGSSNCLCWPRLAVCSHGDGHSGQQQQAPPPSESSDDGNSKKKRDRFKGMSEEEVLMRMLPDHLVPNLDIVIVSWTCLAKMIIMLSSPVVLLQYL